MLTVLRISAAFLNEVTAKKLEGTRNSKMVASSEGRKAELLLESLERGLDGGEPFVSEHGVVSRHLPVLVGETDRVAM